MKMMDLLNCLKDGLVKVSSNIPYLGGILNVIADVSQTFTSFSDVMFVNKVKRVINGIEKVTSLQEQVKIAEKIREIACDEEKFLQLAIWIDEIDDVRKFQYLANLFVSAIYSGMSSELFYMIMNFIGSCTSYQLDYIRDFDFDKTCPMEVNLSYLYQYGIFSQVSDSGSEERIRYCLSRFGVAVKVHCTNYGDTNLPEKPSQIEDLGNNPAVLEPMTSSAIEGMLTPDFAH